MSEEKLVQRHVRKLTNRDSQPEDREASAKWLAEKATNEAMMGLLARFDLNLEHQLKDAGEKEFVYSLLAGLGPKAVEPTKAWLRSCKQFTLPLRLLADLAGADAAVQMAYELLEIERRKDDFKPDKKKGILVWLADQRSAGAVEAARSFLDDFDEGVRYAAAEVLIAANAESAREPLSTLFTGEREQSNRLLIRVAEVFSQRGWRVDEKVGAKLPPGFKYKEGRVYPA